jgi:hypothetical protein
LIQQEEQMKENVERCGAIIETENRYYPVRRRLEQEIGKLVMEVENRRILLGRCQMCPNIRLTESRGQNA